MRTYTAVCRRSGSWWAIEVPEVRGVFSQARRLDQVEAMAREAVALMLDVPEDQVAVTVDVQLDGETNREADEVRRAREAAEEAEKRSSGLTKTAAQRLRDSGLPVRDVGQILGVSYQYVAHITSAPRQSTKSRLPGHAA